jgi:L-methionine (R)-S-oxide reductase
MSDEVESWLKGFIARHGGVAGTIHAVAGEVLALRAAVNIPPPVVELTRSIPSGKGMAGLAWQRDAPVHTCNLKSDETGDVRPGAKAVDASAAVALPVHGEGGAVRGVVGIAWMGERDITEGELAALAGEAEAAPI